MARERFNKNHRFPDYLLNWKMKIKHKNQVTYNLDGNEPKPT